MNTFWAAVAAWFGWNVAAPLFLGVIVLLLVVLWSIPGAIRRALCDHSKFYETRECDAICSKCGKNLGWIGTVRDRVKGGNHDPV